YPENMAEPLPVPSLNGSQFDLTDTQPPLTRHGARDPGRVWLHVLLLLLTVLTTTIVGSRMQFNFAHDLPAFDLDRDWSVFFTFWRHPATLLGGIPFSLTLITILLAHEFGHYLACVYYGVDATLPFLLPALSVGLAFSKIVPGIAHQGSLTFGMPAVLWRLERVIYPGVHPADIY